MERERNDPVRLIEDGDLLDEEKDLVADEAEEEAETLTAEDVPAEEAALRVEEEPPGATDGPDSYLENDSR